ncbi:MAG: 23S rRNA (uracil(1939)-C(5))-methyltransferase RlmD [Ruminococcaceae bacterium]|nr:23S rRNA (uracil(1939)-C(5))-methyltransferase RlmD [Oscillospiraceae bacterium]
MIHYGDMMMLCIEETNMKGCGVAKVEDMVIFCEGAVCGDTVIAFIEEVKKNYARAKALKVVYSSEHRREPLCPHFKECGGCTFGHVSYEHEIEVKKTGIPASFRRAAGFPVEAEKVITGNELGYRNKAVFHFDSEKNAGFYKQGTRELLRIESCNLCHEKIMEIKDVSENLLKADSGIDGEKLTYLYIRYMEKTDEASVVIGYTGDTSLSHFAKELSNSLPYIKCIMKGKEENPEARNEELTLLYGEESISDVFCDMKIRISPRAFYQVNSENAEKMCTLAAELLELKAGDVCLDLYCGTGTIGMTVAKLSPEAKIYGVEINSAAVRNAKENAAANGISNIEFYCGDSKDFAEKTGVSKISSIIVDPPRAGLSKKAVSEILRFAPEKIVYISCNPDTMARDLKALTEKYKIKRVTGIDLFPKTAHIESEILLTRKNYTED